jgi:uncharacterized protein
MTRFSLRGLRLRPGEEHRDTVTVELEPFELGGASYRPEPTDVPALLAIGRATGGDVFTLRFATRLHGPCMRCLADATAELAIEGREYQDADPDAPEEMRCEYVDGDQLDVSAWARDLVGLALPDPILCRPDCAGLCPVCGRDLNLEPHEHEEAVADARWAALRELRDRM